MGNLPLRSSKYLKRVGQIVLCFLLPSAGHWKRCNCKRCAAELGNESPQLSAREPRTGALGNQKLQRGRSQQKNPIKLFMNFWAHSLLSCACEAVILNSIPKTLRIKLRGIPPLIIHASHSGSHMQDILIALQSFKNGTDVEIATTVD